MREIDPNLHTKESRTALTKMVMRLFDHWQISTAVQASLLNRSLSSMRSYRNGGCFANDKEILDRADNLLGIHKSLRIIFPYNRDLVYRWIVAKNDTFNGQAPIEIMKNGYSGIVAVRDYLVFQTQR